MFSNLLQAIERVLIVLNKPATAKTIAVRLGSDESARLGGLTPWKTVGARLAVDIRSNPKTPFMRVERGTYALKAWTDLIPVSVPARRVNPVDEDILVLDLITIEQMKVGAKLGQLFDINYRKLLAVARPVNRMQAEQNYELVQLIPSFIIFMGSSVLSFKRTRKTPEQRLHDSYSIVFGGHLQFNDSPMLFADLDNQIERFIFRELDEELAFAPSFQKSNYSGVLHLENNAFERQHAGLIFVISLEPNTSVRGLEPGFHSSLQFLPWDSLATSPVMADRWSATCIKHMREA